VRARNFLSLEYHAPCPLMLSVRIEEYSFFIKVNLAS
jgi:hypothetical protein